MSEIVKNGNVASETSPDDADVVENAAAKRELTPDLISSSPVKETSNVEIVVGEDSFVNEEEGKEKQNEKEEVLVQVKNRFVLFCSSLKTSSWEPVFTESFLNEA